jgi:hypothetical protein
MTLCTCSCKSQSSKQVEKIKVRTLTSFHQEIREMIGGREFDKGFYMPRGTFLALNNYVQYLAEEIDALKQQLNEKK